MFQTIAGTKSEGKTSHLLDSELGESIHVEVKVGDGLLESEAGGQVSQYKNSTDHVEIQASGDKELNEKEKRESLLGEDVPEGDEIVTAKKYCPKSHLIEEKDFDNITDARDCKMKVMVIIFLCILLCVIVIPSLLM